MAQVWMMTGANLEADVYGRSRDEDYQAESPAPSNQVCPPVCDVESIVLVFQLLSECELAKACYSSVLRQPACVL